MRLLCFLGFGALCLRGMETVDADWVHLSQSAHQSEQSGDLAQAEALRRQAVAAAEQELGPNDKQIAALLSNLAGVLHLEGRNAEAYPRALRALEIAEASADKPLIGAILNQLGLVLMGKGKPERAEPLLRRSLALFEQSEGKEAMDTAKVENNLAALYSDTRRWAMAEPLIRRVLPIYEKNLGPENPEFAAALGNLFTILASQRRAEEGEPYLRRALAIAEKGFPGTAADAHLQVCLGALEFSRRHWLQSAGILRAAIAIEERTLGPDHPELARSLDYYAAVQKQLHNKTEAKRAADRAEQIMKRSVLN